MTNLKNFVEIVVNKLGVKRRIRGVRATLLVSALAAGLALLLLTPYSSSALRAYEAYYNYLGSYPNLASPGWHENAQGLTHDRDNWFIAQETKLWKIPVTHDLNNDVSCGGVVVCRSLDATPALSSEGYNHLADPEHYEFGGKGYVLVPIDGPGGAIAAFDADTLEYIAHAPLSGQIGASWLAIDIQGNLYSSNFDSAAINKYGLDWRSLSSAENPKLILSGPTSIPLFDENGSSLTIKSLQGGVISPSGELLYVAAGFYTFLDPSHGIHVFDLSTGTRIRRSTNGFGLFNFQFHPGEATRDEVEGLTIWDLDDGRAPGIRGQLHAIVVDQDWPDADDVYLKHYTNTLYVDRNHLGAELSTMERPFNTVVKANSKAWDGARIKIKGASYPEWPTFAKRVEVVAHEGSVIIGK